MSLSKQGKCIIVSAPSGSGKTTIVRHLLRCGLGLEFSISACSRLARTGEVDKVDYYFLSPDEFKQKIEANEFIEWEQVYENRYYGTLKSEVERIWQKGNHVIFDVDVMGALNLKKQFGDAALAVFVMPPSVEILEKRLRLRATENENDLQQRVDKAAKEMTYANKGFDVVLHNIKLEKALIEAEKIVGNFLNKA